jgi:hypothetical protein
LLGAFNAVLNLQADHLGASPAWNLMTINEFFLPTRLRDAKTRRLPCDSDYSGICETARAGGLFAFFPIVLLQRLTSSGQISIVESLADITDHGFSWISHYDHTNLSQSLGS